MSDPQPIRILFVEDVPYDVELAERALLKEGLVCTSARVDTKDALLAALTTFNPDLIVSDYAMPAFDGMQALRLSLAQDATRPFIVLTGSLNEETAVACIKAGATDYVLKDRLARLPFAVKEALAQRQVRVDKEAAEQALRDSEELYRQTMESISDAVFLTDDDNRFVLVCPNIDLTFGRSADEAMALGDLRSLIGDGPFIPDVLETELRNVEWTITDRAGQVHNLLVHIRRVHITQATRLYACRDITERKRAEAAVVESNAQFQALFEASPDAIVLIDPQNDWRIADCNRAACEMNGYMREELIGQSIDLLNLTPGPAAERAAYLAQIRRHNVLRHETFHRRKDGTVFPIEVSTCLISLNGREIVLGIDRDATERKRAEEALRDSEERYRRLFSEMFTGAALHQIVVDAEGRAIDYVTLEVNQAFESMMNIPRAAVVGQRAGRFLPPEELAHWLEIFAAVALTGQSTRYEMYSASNRKYFEGSAYCPTAGQFAVIFYDITERKRAEQALRESEEHYRAIFEHAPVGIFQSTPAGRYLSVNPALARLLGYDSTEEAMASITDIATQVHVDPTCRQEFKRRLAEQGSVLEFINQNRRKDGRVITTSTNARAVKDEAGQVVYYEGFMADITERQLAEEALRDSERRERERAIELQTIMDVVPARILIAHDQMCQLVTGNRAAYIDRGIPTGSNLSATVPDNSYAPLFKLRQAGVELPTHEWPLQVAAATGVEIRDLEFEQISGDGVVTYELANVVPMLDEQGRPRGAVGAFIDITERKWAEEALRESEERFRVIFEHANDAIHIDNAADEILNVNSRLCELMGYSREELLRLRVSDLQAPEARLAGHVLQRELAQYGNTLFEGVNVHRSGRRIPVEISVACIERPAGNLYVSIVRDITERKRRERELEAIAAMATALRTASTRAEMLPVIGHQVTSILKTDVTLLHAVEPASGDARIIFGQGLGGDWTGRRIPRGRGIVGQVIATRRPYLTNDVPHEPLCFGPDLTGELAAIACVPLIAQDQIIGALWIGRQTVIAEEEVRLLTAMSDIAANGLQRAQIVETLEQRVADRTRELAAANEHLQELDRLKSKFVSDVSHELRTPVTSLSLYIDLLEHGKPEKHPLYVAQLKQQMARLRSMIEDILDLSRLERDRAEIRLTRIDLNSIVEHVVATQQTAAEAAGLQLGCDVTEPGAFILAQPEQLSRAVTNLLVNAVKYTRAGSIQVKTETRNERACISVVDTGMGIAPEDIPHLFERFYRGKQVAQSTIPGTGLGLAIVKEIVEAHGGIVEVESQLAVGSTFRLWLPLAGEGTV